MNNTIENNGDQIANGQISRDLRVNSGATEPETQLEVVDFIEQCPDVAREEFSAPENWAQCLVEINQRRKTTHVR